MSESRAELIEQDIEVLHTKARRTGPTYGHPPFAPEAALPAEGDSR